VKVVTNDLFYWATPSPSSSTLRIQPNHWPATQSKSRSLLHPLCSHPSPSSYLRKYKAKSSFSLTASVSHTCRVRARWRRRQLERVTLTIFLVMFQNMR
jgi:hypothetical protein